MIEDKANLTEPCMDDQLTNVEASKHDMVERVIANADSLLLPTVRRLMRELDGPHQDLARLLERNILELTSSFGACITRRAYGLTNREIEICNLIRGGMTTSLIAACLNSSPQTVEKHRSNIRRKLGLKGKPGTLDDSLNSLFKA